MSQSDLNEGLSFSSLTVLLVIPLRFFSFLFFLLILSLRNWRLACNLMGQSEESVKNLMVIKEPSHTVFPFNVRLLQFYCIPYNSAHRHQTAQKSCVNFLLSSALLSQIHCLPIECLPHEKLHCWCATESVLASSSWSLCAVSLMDLEKQRRGGK